MVRIPRTKKIKINLTKFFTKEAKKNIIGKPTTSYPTYKSLIKKKMGILLDKAPDNKTSTAKRKGKNHWLVHTGETMRRGFKYKARKRDLLVYANPQKHSGKTYYMTKGGKKPYKQKKPPTYKQIFTWNNAVGYSGIFQKLPVGSKFPKRMVAEVGRQLHGNITKGIKKRYNVKWA